MKSNIAADFYYKPNIFEDEKKSIFKATWLFIGFKSQLENNNDFISRNIGGTPVVVQNAKGTVKAFLNVCSHRFSLIQEAESGNRPMLCPYHGWAYDSNGVPTGIPKKPMFKNYTFDELCEMKLKEYKVDFCGELCFVCLQNEGPSLKEFLGDFYQELLQISASLGRMADVNQMIIKANWKVIVENTLESYHVGAIHANSFKKLGAQGVEFSFTDYHSNWTAEINTKRTDPANRKIDELFADRVYKIDGYKHILVFPSLLISTTHGTSYNFSLIEPVAPDETRFTSYVFTAKTASGERKALLSAFERTLVDFNRQVFDEDKAICQVVQKGVAHTNLSGVLSIEEERVHAFQKVYTQLMENGSKN